MKKIKLNNIKQLVIDGKIRWTNHIIIRLLQRNINQKDIESAILNGEILNEKSAINDYLLKRKDFYNG